MEILDQYKELLSKILETDLKSAEQLIQGFHKMNVKPDAEILYLEAAYYYYTFQYTMSLYYADLSYAMDQDYKPVHQLINYLTDYDGDFSEYKPVFTKDISSYNKHYNILMYKGILPIVDYTVDACAEALQKLGHTVSIIPVGSNDNSKGYSELLKRVNEGVDFAFVFNNIGLNIYYAEKNFYDVTKLKVFNYLFDHPMCFFDSLNNPPATMTLTCVDKKHVDYVRRFYKNVNSSFFFPLGSEESFETENIPWRERTVQALYVGSLKVAEKGLSDEFSDYVYNYLVKHQSETTEYAIEKCYKECDKELYVKIFGEESFEGRQFTTDDVMKLIIERYRFVDLDVNSYYRKMLVQVLVENGIDVDVYGNGWQYPELLNNKHFHFKGLVPQKECLKQMKNTRFVLNSMPWFKDGAHDRVYNAMLAGAVCVTDVSKYLTDEFTDGEDIVFYHLEQMEKLPEIIKYYEAHQDEAEKIAGAGYAKVALGHTWQKRMIELVERFVSEDYE